MSSELITANPERRMVGPLEPVPTLGDFIPVGSGTPRRTYTFTTLSFMDVRPSIATVSLIRRG